MLRDILRKQMFFDAGGVYSFDSYRKKYKTMRENCQLDESLFYRVHEKTKKMAESIDDTGPICEFNNHMFMFNKYLYGDEVLESEVHVNDDMLHAFANTKVSDNIINQILNGIPFKSGAIFYSNKMLKLLSRHDHGISDCVLVLWYKDTLFNKVKQYASYYPDKYIYDNFGGVDGFYDYIANEDRCNRGKDTNRLVISMSRIRQNCVDVIGTFSEYFEYVEGGNNTKETVNPRGRNNDFDNYAENQWNIIYNTMLYFSSHPEWIERVQLPQKEINGNIGRRKREQILLENSHSIIHKISIPKQIKNCIRAKDFIGDAYKINKRFMVRGHWRQQACGKKRQERKLTFIAPFWKGPDDAPLVEHVYNI